MQHFFKHLIEEFQTPLNNPVLVFSLILFIILLSPIVLRKLNIPGIIGLIISGVIIGPHGFYLLEKNSAIDLFSTIGLLYIMFIAGLELDMTQFKANKYKSLLFGFFTFIIPLGVGYPVCFYFLGYDFNASFLTASMFATHTLVAYPIVSKMGVSKNQAVAITVGGTILTDTAVLIILAVIMGNSQGQLSKEFWLTLGASLTIFSGIIFLLIPRIAKWFFKKLESEKHSHYIFVLSIVFFAAFLAEVAGVEPIIGAFMSGLALNRLIPHSSALMNRIEFIGNSLFIPFFLISVGMLVDVRVILSGTTAIIVALTLSIIALIGKWLAALFTQIIFKYSTAQRQLIFGLSSAHAAATLAVILVGYKANILDENILNGTIILILITCIVASFATEKAAKTIVVNSENSDDEILKLKSGFSEHILLPIANVENIDKLLEFTLLIKNKKSANPISILSVVPNNEVAELNIIKSKNKLEEYVKQASATEIKVNVITTIDHNAASGISRTSREIMADTIVLGWPSRQNFIDKFLVPEKSESILNSTNKNTFICQFESPLVTNKRIVLFCPPLSEYEKGFSQWMDKISKLAQELSISMVCHCNKKTENAMKQVISKNKLGLEISYSNFDDWADFLILSRDIKDDDLLIFASARIGSFSYQKILEQIPEKLEKHFSSNSKILIYPYQHENNDHVESYDDFNSTPLTKGIETIQKISKGFGNIFRK